MRISLLIVLGFVAGLAYGRGDLWPAAWSADTASIALLYLLLFLIGLTAGADRNTWRVLRAAGAASLAAPACAILGSAVGAIGFGLLAGGRPVSEMLAVGMGLGYYSLSSVMIEQLRGAELATIALLANILRELTTMLFAIPLGRLFGPLAPVAAGAATASDTTLPAIIAASGRGYAIPAVFTGISLTFLVPILVTVALSLE